MDGPLALAMLYGCLVILNEIDLTPPEVVAGLNTILDGAPLCIAENGGELITPHPMFRFADTALMHAGLVEEVENLGNTLFDEVSRTANDIWNRVYAGKTEVTHKALSPLKTLHSKLMGLSFVEPHVVPVADILHMALSRMPQKGNFISTDLLTLQGVVCLLRDTDALISHAQKIISGYGPATVLDAVLADVQTHALHIC